MTAVVENILKRSDRLDPLKQSPYRDILAPPRETSTGTIFQMVLAAPGILDYADGSDLVPDSTLSDPAWLEDLKGVSVIDDDGDAHWDDGVLSPETIERYQVGMILRAWWNPEHRVVIAEAKVNKRRGLDAIAAGVTGVSPGGYLARMEDSEGELDGKRYIRVQAQRMKPTNVAITTAPRGGQPAQIRADAREKLMEKELEALKSAMGDLASLLGRMDEGMARSDAMAGLVERMDGYDTRFADVAAKMDSLIDMLKPKDDAADMVRADSVQKADSWGPVVKLALRHEVDLGEKSYEDAVRAVAEKVGVKKADSRAVEGLEIFIEAEAERKADAYDRIGYEAGGGNDNQGAETATAADFINEMEVR